MLPEFQRALLSERGQGPSRSDRAREILSEIPWRQMGQSQIRGLALYRSYLIGRALLAKLLLDVRFTSGNV